MGHPQDDHFPHPQVEGWAVEQLVDHLRPAGEYVRSVGEQSEHVEVAATRHPFADRFGLLFDAGERYP